MQNPFIVDQADIVPALPRLNGQRFLLTYSQTTAALDRQLEHFLADLPNFHWCEIAEERHQDGNPHIHVVIVFRKRFQRNMQAFDCEGHHPNIKPIRNGGLDLFRARHYIRKGDSPSHSAENHEEACNYTYEPHPVGAVPRYAVPQPRLTWGELLDGANDVDDFLRGVRQHYPRDYVLRFDQVLTFAQQHFSRPYDYVPARQAEEFRVPDELDEWVESVLRQVSSATVTGTLSFRLRCEFVV